jgi:DNA-binding transcriptional LysR family regulator
MDRLDAIEAFVATVDRGSLSSAARALGRSPASVTRAVASIEERLGAGALVKLLAAFEPEPLPVHLVYPAGSTTTAKVRAFAELALPRLRAVLVAAQSPRSSRSE